jgi:hypothetical protein
MQFTRQERQVFQISTRMILGDGATALFWEDTWLDGGSIADIAPELYALIPRRPRKRRTVREALVDRSWIMDISGALQPIALWQYVQLWIRLRDVHLTVEPDKLIWQWTADGQFSSRSCYNALFEG